MYSEKKGIAVEVLTQKQGTELHSMAYLSKKLNEIAMGWQGCLRAIAATEILMKEATKITLGQQLEFLIPHQVRDTLELKSHL
jgi:hypothetical protein